MQKRSANSLAHSSYQQPIFSLFAAALLVEVAFDLSLPLLTVVVVVVAVNQSRAALTGSAFLVVVVVSDEEFLELVVVLVVVEDDVVLLEVLLVVLVVDFVELEEDEDEELVEVDFELLMVEEALSLRPLVGLASRVFVTVTLSSSKSLSILELALRRPLLTR